MSATEPSSGVLHGLRVLDFTTLLPGPLCTRMLAACGADVIKVERPGLGDEMRDVPPMHEGRSLPFALLNAGKRSVTLDLKQAEGRSKAMALIREADVLVEQFRPGAMTRLGLDYDTLKAECPDLIYCSITGYGQNGPLARLAGHDLNYAALAGMLRVTTPDGVPGLPPVPVADLAGGSYPALINILLALRRRDRGEGGMHLDIDMSANLATLMYGAFAAAQAPEGFRDPRIYSGGSPRYRIYETRDGRFLAVAAVEERFWQRFCALAGIPQQADADAVAHAIRRRSAAEWEAALAGEDVCCTVVASPGDYFGSAVCPDDGERVAWGPAGEARNLPLPIDSSLRVPKATREVPSAGATSISFRPRGG